MSARYLVFFIRKIITNMELVKYLYVENMWIYEAYLVNAGAHVLAQQFSLQITILPTVESLPSSSAAK